MQDLSKLSKQDKLELIELLEEKQKRARDKKPLFSPHPGQMRVIQSDALERYLFCGNGFGKSTVLVNEIHWAATGYNPIKKTKAPVPAKICLLLDAPEKANDFVTEYRKWNRLEPEQLHKAGKPQISYITYDNGSTITIMTHAVEPLKLEGSQWTHIFADEPPPKPVFTALFRGGRIKGHPLKTLLAGTPIAAAWLRTDVFEPWSKGEIKDAECFRGDTYENEGNLEPGFIERFSGKLSEHEKSIRIRGEFYDLEGLALSHLFRTDTHVISKSQLEWERTYPTSVVMDPHPSKAHHAVLMGCDRYGFLYVLDEYKEKALARKFINSLISRGWFRDYRVTDIVYDSLGSSEMTSGEGFKPFGEVINEELSKHGIGRARATRYDEKNDEDFINRIQDALALPKDIGNFGVAIPKLRLLSHCTGSIADIRQVQWKRDKTLDQNKPSLEISNRDFLSCIKYALACNLTISKKKEKAYYVRGNPYGVGLTETRKTRMKKMIYGRGRRSDDDDNW